MTTLSEQLESVGACPDAVEWAQGYDDAAIAWAACERGDWMLWLLGRVAAGARLQCADIVRKWFPEPPVLPQMEESR